MGLIVVHFFFRQQLKLNVPRSLLAISLYDAALTEVAAVGIHPALAKHPAKAERRKSLTMSRGPPGKRCIRSSS